MRKLGVLVLLIALAMLLSSFGAAWKWGGHPSKQAGWTWDRSQAAYVWVD